MDPHKSFFKVYRSIYGSWLEEKPFCKAYAWLWIVGHAQFETTKVMVHGKPVTVRRGQLMTSIVQLSKTFGWDRRTVGKYIDSLEALKMITTKRTAHGTTITVENYDKYQNAGTTERTTKRTAPCTTPCTTPVPEGLEFQGAKGAIKNVKKECIKNARARDEKPLPAEDLPKVMARCMETLKGKKEES